MAFIPGCFGFLFELKGNYQNNEDKEKEKRFELYSDYEITRNKNFKIIEWNE